MQAKHETNNPLTIEELRQMHGQPVWIEQENAWGIVNVDKYGRWKDIPFVLFFYESVKCEYDIESRGLTCYRHEPVRHSRWFEMVDSVEDGHTGEYYDEIYYNCLACDYATSDKTPYCPHCGSRMDGGADNG